VTKNRMLLVTLAFLLFGSYLIYQGLAPYPIRDMNGDGEIDWHDYDVNVDGKVDMTDIGYVSAKYGSSIGDAEYDANCDFNGDGVIDDFDLDVMEEYFGQPLDIISLIGRRLSGAKGLQVIGGFGCILLAIVLTAKWRLKQT